MLQKYFARGWRTLILTLFYPTQTAQMRFENRLNAVRSQVFGEREDMSEVLEEKRRREKETLLKQMEECRRRKEQERIREEELQRLDDERVERYFWFHFVVALHIRLSNLYHVEKDVPLQNDGTVK